MANMPQHPTLSCATCGTTQETGGTPLQRCSRCRNAHYCSRDCQKADWKTHKAACGSGASASTSAGSKPRPKSSKAFIETLLGAKTTDWLSRVPEAEAFTLLIDSYRMRVEDELNFRGDMDEDSVYGSGDPTVGFRKYLLKAEEKRGALPAWWNEQKREACIAKGNARDHWSCLHFAVEKSDVQEHYKDGSMPMQLRMLAEEILGSNVMNPF